MKKTVLASVLSWLFKPVYNKAITISPGTLSITVAVPVYHDGKTENNECFYVNLTEPTNCVFGDVTDMVNMLHEGTSSSARLTTGVKIGHVIGDIRPINSSLRVGHEWNAGIYIVEVVQGLNRKTIKQIKY